MVHSHVLVVDESRDVCEMYAEVLTSVSLYPNVRLSVTIVTSIAAAYGQLARQRFHALVVAIRYEHGGFELAYTAKRLHPQLVTLLVGCQTIGPTQSLMVEALGLLLLDAQMAQAEVGALVAAQLGVVPDCADTLSEGGGSLVARMPCDRVAYRTGRGVLPHYTDEVSYADGLRADAI